MQHSVWNMYSVINNGLKSGRRSVSCNQNRMCLQILRVFYKEGYITGFRKNRYDMGLLEVFLKYENGKPVIRKIFSVSKPGRRFYIPTKTIWKIDTSLITLIVSTPLGILSDKDCRRYGQGGEILGIVF